MNLKKVKLYVPPVALIVCIIYFFYASLHKNEIVQAQEVLTMVAEKSSMKYETAIFAGGCFWSMEAPFEKLEGVLSVVSGYTGGQKENPTYAEVSSGTTGHLESVEVHYNPNQITYDQLLQVYWRNVDPTDANGQFIDRGEEYRSVIYYNSNEQKELAEASKEALASSGKFDKPIKTKVLPAATFYKAEEEHQDYYKKNPISFKINQLGSGRDIFLDKAWGNDRVVKSTVSQYKDFNDNKAEGIYVDIVSGEPLFSSKDQFDPGTGWPSFTKALEPNNIIFKENHGLFSVVTEVKSHYADSSLGHVFNDGPKPTGLRFCINSAALQFIPKNELVKRGYGLYAEQFKKIQEA